MLSKQQNKHVEQDVLLPKNNCFNNEVNLIKLLSVIEHPWVTEEDTKLNAIDYFWDILLYCKNEYGGLRD